MKYFISALTHTYVKKLYVIYSLSKSAYFSRKGFNNDFSKARIFKRVSDAVNCIRNLNVDISKLEIREYNITEQDVKSTRTVRGW